MCCQQTLVSRSMLLSRHLEQLCLHAVSTCLPSLTPGRVQLCPYLLHYGQ